MSRILILPDIHNKIRIADRVIEKEAADENIFLGDYFHNFGETINFVFYTARWLKEKLRDPNNVMLLGNHDASHRWPECEAVSGCPGWSQEKQKVVDEVLTKEDWARTSLHCWRDDFLISHAGVSPEFLIRTEDQKAHIDTLAYDAIDYANNGMYHPFIGAGADRGGPQSIGGITWLDWTYLAPVPGLNQIVGHTPENYVRTRHSKKSQNFCLDTHLHHYAILEDGNLEFKIIDRTKK